MFYLLAGMSFLSAFLLFQIELIIARLLLPLYGGSYWVWGSCVVFFQAILLLGYIFCQRLIGRFGMFRYRWWHVGVMLAPFLFFPGRELSLGSAMQTGHLAFDVFFQLLRTIGPVFFVLSIMGVMTQMWLAASRLPQRANPYALYAVSNLGSFMALLTYPFVFEVLLGSSVQLAIWRGLYGVLILLVVVTARFLSLGEAKPNEASVAPPVGFSQKALWFVLGAGGVVLFLSVNNLMTYELPPVPLLWVWPLAIYLVAFTLAFKRTPWLPSWVMNSVHVWLGLALVLFFFSYKPFLPVSVEAVGLLFFLFVLCLYCQGRLYQERPEDPAHLPEFYVIMALGGLVGGFVTSWIVPLITQSPLEYILGLAIVALAAGWKTEGSVMSPRLIRLVCWFLIFMGVWPQVFERYHFWGIVLMVTMVTIVFRAFGKMRFGTNFALIMVIACWPSLEPFWENPATQVKYRNYYGIYKILEDGHLRTLVSGTTRHGSELIRPGFQGLPTQYYAPSQPVYFLYHTESLSLSRSGVIGLGTGTMAAYLRQGQTMDFYELDPEVETIARKHFSYLARAKGDVNVFLGDARLELLRRERPPYDIIVVDAFGGDSIPVHLLNQDMIRLYRERILSNGLLVFHISNRYIELDGVLAAIAKDEGAHILRGKQDIVEWHSAASRWVVLTWDDATRDAVDELDTWELLTDAVTVRPWSDDYINILPTLKYRPFLDSLKTFQMFYW